MANRKVIVDGAIFVFVTLAVLVAVQGKSSLLAAGLVLLALVVSWFRRDLSRVMG